MPRRVKKRNQSKAQSASAHAKANLNNGGKTPKSMVIRAGASQVGSSVSQLVKDVRLMMEPDTAVRLKVWQPVNQLLGLGPCFSNSMLSFCRNANLID